MLSSRQLELLLRLEQHRREHHERLCSGRRSELRTLIAQRSQLEQLVGEYRSAQAAFSGSVIQLQQQVRLSGRLLRGLDELASVIEAAEQRLAAAEQMLQQTHQRCQGWQQQLTETLARERRSERRKARRRLERRWLEGRRERSKI